MRKHRFQKQLILMQALVTSWRYLFTICDGTEWHQMITLMAFPFANTTLKYVDCILMARVHSADCSLGLLFICMEKKWNASIRCVNNLPPTMKAATCCAASVTWQPTKTCQNPGQSHVVGVQYLLMEWNVIWGIWMRQGRERHVCLSASRRVAWETVGSHVQEKKNKKKNGWAKVFHFDWLGSMQMEDNERKPFCTSAVRKVGQHFIWAPQPYGASQYVLCNCFAPVLFFNLSNYLACPSWGGGGILLYYVPHYHPSHYSLKHLASPGTQSKTPLFKPDIYSYWTDLVFSLYWKKGFQIFPCVN